MGCGFTAELADDGLDLVMVEFEEDVVDLFVGEEFGVVGESGVVFVFFAVNDDGGAEVGEGGLGFAWVVVVVIIPD